MKLRELSDTELLDPLRDFEWTNDESTTHLHAFSIEIQRRITALLEDEVAPDVRVIINALSDQARDIADRLEGTNSLLCRGPPHD